MTVLFDLQATQSVDQRHRGIPRYVADLAFAIEAIDPAVIGTYTVNPDLAIPEMGVSRSEERRVGKECRSRWSPYH